MLRLEEEPGRALARDPQPRPTAAAPREHCPGKGQSRPPEGAGIALVTAAQAAAASAPGAPLSAQGTTSGVGHQFPLWHLHVQSGPVALPGAAQSFARSTAAESRAHPEGAVPSQGLAFRACSFPAAAGDRGEGGARCHWCKQPPVLAVEVCREPSELPGAAGPARRREQSEQSPLVSSAGSPSASLRGPCETAAALLPNAGRVRELGEVGPLVGVKGVHAVVCGQRAP